MYILYTQYEGAYLLYKIIGIMMNITTEVMKSTAATPPAIIIVTSPPAQVKVDIALLTMKCEPQILGLNTSSIYFC